MYSCKRKYFVLLLPALLTCYCAEPIETQSEYPESHDIHRAPPPAQPPIVVPQQKDSFQITTEETESAVRPTRGPVRYDIGSPSDEEQLIVAYINRARADAAAEALRLKGTSESDIINAYDFFDVDLDQFVNDMDDLPSSLPPLAINKKLMQASALHSQDMFDNAFQGHQSSTNPPSPHEPGDTIGDRASRQNYDYSRVGENVYSYAESIPYAHAAMEVDWGNGPGGMQDPPGHRLNIHSEEFKEIGVGIIDGKKTMEGNTVGPVVLTQDFGTAQNSSAFITGVAYFDLDGNKFYDVGEGIGGVRVDVDGMDYYAVTSDSGGYAIPAENGTYTLTFSGTGFSGNDVEATINNDENIKTDFVPEYKPPEISGDSTPASGIESAYTLTASPGTTGYSIKILQLGETAWIEGAENGAENLTDHTHEDYALISDQYSLNGNHSLHLAHETSETQTVTLTQGVLATEGSSLQFNKQMGIANVDQKVEAQVSADGGTTWETVWSEFGDMVSGDDGYETTFSQITVLLDGYAGDVIQIRFRFFLEYNEQENADEQTNYFPGSATDYGVYLDDITVSDGREVLGSEQRDINNTGEFSFTPRSPGTYVLRAAGINNFNGDEKVHRFPWGELFEVTAQKHYTVIFKTGPHATRIGGGQLEQFVIQGENATEPNLDVDPGWTLTGWDTDFTNVQEDLTVDAEYSDNDVLPDEWEKQIVDAVPDDSVETILDVKPHDDFDDDGWSNLQEYENDTDPTRYVLQLQEGWNLISIAFAPSDYSVEGIFGDNIIELAWCWSDSNYQKADNVVPTEGHWVLSSNAETINIGEMSFSESPDSDGDGLADSVEDDLDTDPDKYIITLESGWNLISLCRVPEDNTPEGIFGDKIIMPVWEWKDRQYQEAQEIKPLRGYWVYSKGKQTIDIGSILP